MDTAVLLPLLVGFVGALLGGVMFERLFARRAVAGIVTQLEALLAGERPTHPIRHERAARVVASLGARLVAVEALATVDQLTGVLNRRAGIRQMEAELSRAARHHRAAAVALLDLDHFKRVNDSYGHAAGDEVLHHVAQLMRAQLRAADIVARYGGEEFLIVLPDTSDDGAIAVLEKLRRQVGRTPVKLPDGTELAVTISAGLRATDGTQALEVLTRDADIALYAAKANGRDQVHLFRPADEDRVIRSQAISSQAREAAGAIAHDASAAARDHLAAVLAARGGGAERRSDRIADLAVRLAEALDLPASEVDRIRTAGLLHDIGTLAIPEGVLDKPSQLSEPEWRMVREHTRISHLVLEQAGALRDSAALALHHHEWFNGRGYPHGLAASDIPLGARIVAIVDAYVAMTSARPYRRARSHLDALRELQRFAGTQFDPKLVDTFIASFPADLASSSLSSTGTNG